MVVPGTGRTVSYRFVCLPRGHDLFTHPCGSSPTMYGTLVLTPLPHSDVKGILTPWVI